MYVVAGKAAIVVRGLQYGRRAPIIFDILEHPSFI